MGLGAAIRLAVPGLPVSTPVEYVVLALAVSFTVGILSGILPARRAAGMDPIQALAAE
jgi:putative ABC transport system permease protein